ncbi:hypothetical protein POPTR_017G031150v4 [Populus trichocarpa]|uniref:Uncharacterized protein n=1 Tax=Populus trichocarpa TaxID=3694 RepID=A0ACC0RQ33_POPTR|nr:hypothetical protein POPTR_017G031150v4 [Populus trichocarpa]
MVHPWYFPIVQPIKWGNHQLKTDLCSLTV